MADTCRAGLCGRMFLCRVAVVALLIPDVCAAENGLSVRAAMEQAYADNVRSAPVVGGPASVAISSWKLSAVWEHNGKFSPDRLGAVVRGRLFDRGFHARDFVEFKPYASWELFGGQFGLEYAYSPKRLRLEEDDGGDGVFFRRNSFNSDYQFRFGHRKMIRMGFEAEAEEDAYGPAFAERDSWSFGGGANLRVRFHDLFVPRLRYSFLDRDAERDNFDREERTLLLGLDSHLPWNSLLQLRYKRSSRRYSVEVLHDLDGVNKNFGRRDRIHQYEATLSVPVPRVPYLRVSLRYQRREGGSTRASRLFTRDEFGLGLAYDLY